MGSTTSRLWFAFNPRGVAKSEGALRFGILGVANIVPLALLLPAKSHPEVIVQAVSSRSRQKAEAFAKKYRIPDVRGSYQELIDDPDIDCVFIPLPNSLHYEWAVKALRKGKHVLLEKPSVANSVEAEALFRNHRGLPDGRPVLMEAFHNRFHPAWAPFERLVDTENVVHVRARSMIPWWYTHKDDICFNYGLAGGAMMHMGTYGFAALRTVFGAEPEECVSCDVDIFKGNTHAEDKIDKSFKASFRFPNGGTGVAESTLCGPTVWTPSCVTVKHRECVVPDETLPASRQKVRIREVRFHGFIHAVAWHRLDVFDTFEIREGSVTVKRWREKSSHTAYGGDDEINGEKWWMSYRYQLEEFVNRIKGRETRAWIEAEDSVAQMKMIDLAYEKSGLGRRKTSACVEGGLAEGS
ncbi:putative oxidoreductase [Xylariaceae sp. FL0594]|nr:putative oxidoreductase [Xylariaceae sp. FL0594]